METADFVEEEKKWIITGRGGRAGRAQSSGSGRRDLVQAIRLVIDSEKGLHSLGES